MRFKVGDTVRLSDKFIEDANKQGSKIHSFFKVKREGIVTETLGRIHCYVGFTGSDIRLYCFEEDSLRLVRRG